MRIKSQSCFSGIRHLQRSEIISRLSGVGLSGPLVHSFNLFQRQQRMWRYTWFSLLSLVLVEHPSRRHWRPFVGCMSKRIRWTLQFTLLLVNLKQHYFVFSVALLIVVYLSYHTSARVSCRRKIYDPCRWRIANWQHWLGLALLLFFVGTAF